MRLYLMRHGEALPETTSPDRPLSRSGRRQAQSAGLALRKMGVRFDAVFCSPKPRALMTAQIVAEVTEFPQASIVETPTLTPSALPDTALAFVANFQHMEDVLVAGHIPSLTRMAAVLLAGNAFATITLETTGICCIACETLPTHSGVMQWLLTPEQLRLIAGNHGA